VPDQVTIRPCRKVINSLSGQFIVLARFGPVVEKLISIAYYIIKAVLREVIDPKRVVMRYRLGISIVKCSLHGDHMDKRRCRV